MTHRFPSFMDEETCWVDTNDFKQGPWPCQLQGQPFPLRGTSMCTMTLVLSDLVTNCLSEESSGMWLQNVSWAIFLTVISAYTQNGKMPPATGCDQSVLPGSCPADTQTTWTQIFHATQWNSFNEWPFNFPWTYSESVHLASTKLPGRLTHRDAIWSLMMWPIYKQP